MALRKPSEMGTDTSVLAIDGIGPKKQEMLEKMGIRTFGDLCCHFPRAYEHRGLVKNTAEVEDGEVCSVIVKTDTPILVPAKKTKVPFSKMVSHDDTGRLDMIFFHCPYISGIIHINSFYRIYGKFRRNGKILETVNPVYELVTPAKPLRDYVPVYPLTGGINQKFMGEIVEIALNTVLKPNNSYGFSDMLPYEIKRKYGLAEFSYALRKIHFPDSSDEVQKARKRLAFDEVFLYSLKSLYFGKKEKSVPGIRFDVSSSKEFLESLPYLPTGAQLRTMREIAADVKSGYRMTRLITGDVGSGKTVCAAYALFLALKNGYKAALMAPTEILARQHYQSLKDMFASFGMETCLLVGATKAAQKKKIIARLGEKEPVLVIGTHALIEDSVVIENLGLIVIDEQHRFGASQREKLRNKSRECHLVSMSATPIPRTLALVLYGDMDISAIDEMPPGRQVVDTFLVNESYRKRIDDFIVKNVKDGGQVYIVCPSVEEQETVETESGENVPLSMLEQFLDRPDKPKLKAAVNYAKELETKFPDLKIGFIHGKMKAEAKEKVMNSFARGKTDILVSTTVIEVGVNVPNATLMIIENAEFFGLSGLHQLRGRVGRGTRKSYCVLFTDTKNPKTLERLHVLKDNHDGYKIAEYDLKQRGPGDFIAETGKKIRQSGDADFKLAELIEDQNLLYQATEAAKSVMEDDPRLRKEKNKKIRENLEHLIAKNNLS